MRIGEMEDVGYVNLFSVMVQMHRSFWKVKSCMQDELNVQEVRTDPSLTEVAFLW